MATLVIKCIFGLENADVVIVAILLETTIHNKRILVKDTKLELEND